MGSRQRRGLQQAWVVNLTLSYFMEALRTPIRRMVPTSTDCRCCFLARDTPGMRLLTKTRYLVVTIRATQLCSFCPMCRVQWSNESLTLTNFESFSISRSVNNGSRSGSGIVADPSPCRTTTNFSR